MKDPECHICGEEFEEGDEVVIIQTSSVMEDSLRGSQLRWRPTKKNIHMEHLK